MKTKKKQVKKKVSKKENSKIVKEEFIQLCPICGSKDFNFFKVNRPVDIASGELYKCERCKNVFSFPIELPKEEADKLKKVELTKDIINDTPASAYTSLGNFQIQVYWKILAFVTIILAIASFYLSTVPFFCNMIEEEVFCIFNEHPKSFILYGIALLFSSVFFFIESMFLYKSNSHLPRIIRTAIILGLILIIVFTGSPVLFSY